MFRIRDGEKFRGIFSRGGCPFIRGFDLRKRKTTNTCTARYAPTMTKWTLWIKHQGTEIFNINSHEWKNKTSLYFTFIVVGHGYNFDPLIWVVTHWFLPEGYTVTIKTIFKMNHCYRKCILPASLLNLFVKLHSAVVCKQFIFTLNFCLLDHVVEDK